MTPTQHLNARLTPRRFYVYERQDGTWKNYGPYPGPTIAAALDEHVAQRGGNVVERYREHATIRRWANNVKVDTPVKVVESRV